MIKNNQVYNPYDDLSNDEQVSGRNLNQPRYS